jgi:multidrug resistance efflux pump
MFHRRPAAIVGVCAVLFWAVPASSAPATDAVGGTGRIEPRGGMVSLSGAPGALIKNIAVHVGDFVRQGALLVTLDDDSARAQQEIAQLAYNQTKLVSDQSVANERMQVEVMRKHYEQAQSDADAYRALGPTATSTRQIATSDTAAFEAKAAWQAEQSKLRQASAGATSDIASAARRLKVANDTLATYQVRAPSSGTILRIDQHAGENAAGPLIELGDISAMYVVAQVFQGDLLKIAPGMKAHISNTALGRDLSGTVEQVSRLVDTKAQLGDVRIRLDDTNLASRVVGMEVEVKIAR